MSVYGSATGRIGGKISGKCLPSLTGNQKVLFMSRLLQAYVDITVRSAGPLTEEVSSPAQSAFVPVHETKLKKAFNEC